MFSLKNYAEIQSCSIKANTIYQRRMVLMIVVEMSAIVLALNFLIKAILKVSLNTVVKAFSTLIIHDAMLS